MADAENARNGKYLNTPETNDYPVLREAGMDPHTADGQKKLQEVVHLKQKGVDKIFQFTRNGSWGRAFHSIENPDFPAPVKNQVFEIPGLGGKWVVEDLVINQDSFGGKFTYVYTVKEAE